MTLQAQQPTPREEGLVLQFCLVAMDLFCGTPLDWAWVHNHAWPLAETVTIQAPKSICSSQSFTEAQTNVSHGIGKNIGSVSPANNITHLHC